MTSLIEQIAEKMQNTYYGKYRGFVADNNDPSRLGRLRLTVPSLLGEAVTHWALPCMPFGGLADQGQFTIPEPGAQVWVEFEEGLLAFPIWTGTFWQNDGDVPASLESDAPDKRVFKTPSGHMLEFTDTEEKECITIRHKSGARMDFTKEGMIVLNDANGATLYLDAEQNQVDLKDANANRLTMNASGTTVEDSNGNQIEMAASGITLKGPKIVIDGSQVMLGGQGGEPVIKGQSFLNLFMTHVHPTASPGSPTLPPVPQGEMSALSMKVTTS